MIESIRFAADKNHHTCYLGDWVMHDGVERKLLELFHETTDGSIVAKFHGGRTALTKGMTFVRGRGR